MKIGKFYCH